MAIDYMLTSGFNNLKFVTLTGDLIGIPWYTASRRPLNKLWFKNEALGGVRNSWNFEFDFTNIATVYGVSTQMLSNGKE